MLALIKVFGGLGLFLYGLRLLAEQLQVLCGSALQRLIRRARSAPTIGIAAGTAVTAVTQSATAVGVMTANLMQRGTLRAREGLAILLGAAVGGTLAVQLVALRAVDYAIPLIGLGFLASLIRSARVKQIGLAAVGLGLGFLGLDIMIKALEPVRDAPLLQALIAQISGSALAMALAGLAITLILHSSNAPVVLILALVASGLVPINAALAFVIGANVGTPVNVILMTLREHIEFRRAAFAHLVIKIIAAGLALLALTYVAEWLEWLDADPTRRVATAHTLFNVVAAFSALPFLALLERLGERYLPTPPAKGPQPKYLDQEALQSPDFAYRLAFREVSRVADHLLRMAQAAFEVNTDDPKLLERVRHEEEVVDSLVHEVVKYLGSLQDRLPNDKLLQLLGISTSLEGIGDLLKRILRQRGKLWQEGLQLSPEGRAELDRIETITLERAKGILTALAVADMNGCAPRLRESEEVMASIEQSRLAHLTRLREGREESVLTSTVHLDLLTVMEQINNELNSIIRRAPVQAM